MPDRFFAERIADPGTCMELESEEARHAVRVLRLRPGAVIELVDGAGGKAIAELVKTTIDRSGAGVVCRVRKHLASPLPRLALRLYVAPPRGKVFSRIIRQAVELGVARITPVLTRYTVDRPTPTFHDRARAECIAALKQSGNPVLPRIDPVRIFQEVVDESREPGYFGAPPGELDSVRSQPAPVSGPVNIWIGPEGGFSPDEQERLRAVGLVPVTLGPWTLRVDTAVVAMIGWLLGPRQ